MKRLITVLLLFSLVGFEVPHDTSIPDNAVGVWECPSIGTETPLYWTEATGQDIIDADNSAAFKWYGKGRAIEDHVDSECGGGKWNVNEIQVGSSAFLITSEETQQYQCVMVCKGEVMGWSYFYDNNPIRIHSDEILCACCADDDNGRYIAVFKYVGVMP